jgi:hypothetical protein
LQGAASNIISGNGSQQENSGTQQ